MGFGIAFHKLRVNLEIMKATLGKMATIFVSFCLLGASSAEASYQLGTVVAWGDNSSGQTNVPAGLTSAVAVAGGLSHSLALKADGTVVAWGDNSWNQRNVPAGLTNAVAIAAGQGFSLALRANRTVVAWGGSFYGWTNVPPGLTNVVAIAGGFNHSLALKADGTVVAWGENTWGQTNVPAGLTSVIAIAGGNEYSLALKSNGTLVAWGYYWNGTNWIPMAVPGLTNVVAIAGGYQHSLALKSDGTVVAWGAIWNGSGEEPASVPSALTSINAIACGGSHNLALKSDGTAVAWGYNSSGQTNVPLGMTNILTIAGGGSHSLAITLTLVPVVLSKPPTTIPLAFGASTNLSVSIWSASPFTCQWFLNGVLIGGAIGTNLDVGNFDLTKAGAYSVTVSNLNGYATVVSVLRLTNSPVVLVDGVDVGGGSVSRIASAQISMSSTFGGSAHIYYTLDGSAPSFLSTPYNGLFQLSRTATIRAMAYNSAYVSSAEAAPITVEVVPIYRLLSSTPGGGSTAFSPAAYSGGDYFVSNTTVTITATPASGWSFLGWLGDAAGPNPVATLTMTRDMAVQALFGTAVTSNALGAGQIWFGRQVSFYPYGTTLAVAAIPQTGSYLINWAGALNGSNNPNVLVVTTPNPIITALFGSLSAGRYALTVLPQGAGSVTVSPYTNRYASGTVVTVTAVPGSGQTFTGWSGDASGSQNPLTVTMTQSKVIAANFTSRPTLSTVPPLNRMAEQGFRFSLTGELGMACRMDGSSNLSSWVPLGWLTNDFGTSQFLDPAALTNAAQFYRAMTQ